MGVYCLFRCLQAVFPIHVSDPADLMAPEGLYRRLPSLRGAGREEVQGVLQDVVHTTLRLQRIGL